MSFNFKKKSLFIILLGGFLTACEHPPKRETPVSALDLALREVEQMGGNRAVAAQPVPVTTLPLPELQSAASKPPIEINQTGTVPVVQSIPPANPPDIDLSRIDPSKVGELALNYEQTSLGDIIKDIVDALGLSAVVDPTIGDKVTVRTPPLKKEQVLPILQLLLTDAGISMERKAGVYHFKKTGPSLPRSMSASSEMLKSSTEAEVMQIVPLRYVSTDSALALLNPILQPQGRALSLPSLNVLGIITTPDKLDRINNLLSILDADPFTNRGIRLFRLQNAKAVEVKTELDKVLQAIVGNSSPYQTIALERTNSIIVVAPPRVGFKEVSMWLEILDERSEESAEQIFIYKVRNLEAKDLAATLSDVFKTEDKKDELPKQETDPKLANPASQLPSQLPLNMADNAAALAAEQAANQPASAGEQAVSAALKVNIVADEKTNNLIIRATPRDYRQLLTTIAQLDEVPKEVMVNVVVAEITLNDSNRFGIDWQAVLGNQRGTVGQNFDMPAGNFPANVQPTGEGAVTSAAGLSGFNINFISGSVKALLNIVSEQSDVRVLSRPSLLVRNKEKASINIGSSEPVITRLNSSTVTGQQVSNDVQYRDVGVNLQVEPQINEDGIINMKISQDISGVGAIRNGLTAFTQRKLETLVVVKDGTAIVIGGLIQDDLTNSENGIPVLKDAPLLGKALFSSNERGFKRTELVLIIVPEIVDPQIDHQRVVETFRHRMTAISDLLNEQQFFLPGIDLPQYQPSFRQALPVQR